MQMMNDQRHRLALFLDPGPLYKLQQGVAIPSNQLGKIQPLRADIHIGDHHSEPLGRVATQAWVFNPAPSPDIIP
jgi:hypothetical protein